MMYDDPQMNFSFVAPRGPVAQSNMLMSTTSAIEALKSWMLNPGVASNDNAKLSSNEIASIHALVTHVAQNSEIGEYRIEQELANHFQVANIRLLAGDQFDAALCYLMDMLKA